MAASKTKRSAAKPKAAPKKRKRKGHKPPTPTKKAPTGKRLTAAKQSLRDTQMLVRKHQGFSIREIAAEVGLSQKQTRTIIKEKQAAQEKLLELDALEIIERLVEELQASIGDFEKIALAAIEQHHLPAAVGAKRSANDARKELRELLQSVGALPHDLGTLTHLIDFRAVVAVLFDTVEGFVKQVEEMKLPKAKRQQVLNAAGTVTAKLDELGGVSHNGKDE